MRRPICRSEQRVARPEKTAVVDEIRTKLDESDAAVLTEYRGLTVTELAQLRGTLRPAGTEYKVFKNSLARLAVEAAGLPELVPMLEGPVAIAFVHGDAVVAARFQFELEAESEIAEFPDGEEIAAAFFLADQQAVLRDIAGGCPFPSFQRFAVEDADEALGGLLFGQARSRRLRTGS